MKVWITKYALTDGIIEVEVMQLMYLGHDIVAVNLENDTRSINLCSDECYLSKEPAIQKAEEMRQKKIASLKKQIEKLEEMRFE